MALPLPRLMELKKTHLSSKPPVDHPSLPEYEIQPALKAGEISVWDWDFASGGHMRWSDQMFRNIGLRPYDSGDLYRCLPTAVAASFATFRNRVRVLCASKFGWSRLATNLTGLPLSVERNPEWTGYRRGCAAS
jgi:hypothetical protein